MDVIFVQFEQIGFHEVFISYKRFTIIKVIQS